MAPRWQLGDEDELYWLALRMVPGLGTVRSKQLLDRFQTPQSIFRASPQELEAAGLSGSLARSVSSGCSFEDAADQQGKIRGAGARLIPITSPLYPDALRRIYDPPVMLFASGCTDLLSTVCLGVVGTRHPTPYGVAATERLAGDLARAGITIVSGMARGIDTAAHRSCLSAGGNTVAVLGCGVDVVYPTENRRLAAEIAAKGLVLSEFPMGTAAFPQNFPIRNRIVSGLSCGILVVEGAQYSGSAITAKLAIDQGREVFAVPGNITSKMSWGPNLLIKQGAKLIQDWNDVVLELPDHVQRRLITEGRERILNAGLGIDAAGGKTRAESLPGSGASDASGSGPGGVPGTHPQADASRRVLRQLKTDALTHLDALVEQIDDLSPSEIIASLFELEILGLVRQQPGRNFIKVW